MIHPQYIVIVKLFKTKKNAQYHVETNKSDVYSIDDQFSFHFSRLPLLVMNILNLLHEDTLKATIAYFVCFSYHGYSKEIIFFRLFSFIKWILKRLVGLSCPKKSLTGKKFLTIFCWFYSNFWQFYWRKLPNFSFEFSNYFYGNKLSVFPYFNVKSIKSSVQSQPGLTLFIRSSRLTPKNGLTQRST